MIDHFGIFAPFYDRIFKPTENHHLFNELQLPDSGKLLDAGGGTGRVSQYLVDLGNDIIVADLSFDMLLQANAKTNLKTVCSSTEGLPFQANIFDRIIMIDAFHHVSNQGETALELQRVLKPGGRIIIEEPDINKISVKMLALVEKLMGMRSHFMSPKEIAALFNHGKTRIKIDGIISWVIISI